VCILPCKVHMNYETISTWNTIPQLLVKEIVRRVYICKILVLCLDINCSPFASNNACPERVSVHSHCCLYRQAKIKQVRICLSFQGYFASFLKEPFCRSCNILFSGRAYSINSDFFILYSSGLSGMYPAKRYQRWNTPLPSAGLKIFLAKTRRPGSWRVKQSVLGSHLPDYTES
jgi:hypothetical protein